MVQVALEYAVEREVEIDLADKAKGFARHIGSSPRAAALFALQSAAKDCRNTVLSLSFSADAGAQPSFLR